MSSMKETAKALGLHHNYFSMMKFHSGKKYEYISKLDKDIIKAFHKYQDEMVYVKNRITQIYYELEEKRMVSSFSRFLKAKKLYTHNNSFLTSAPSVIFSSRGTYGAHRSFLKHKKAVELYEEFKKSL